MDAETRLDKCAKCHATINLEYGLEPTKHCHGCAHEIAESLEWIKITDDPETLPPCTKVDYDSFKESIFYLVMDKERNTFVAQFTVPTRKDGKPFWSDRNGSTIYNVTHWSNVPSPPEV
jgi:hypothetical protein